MKIHRSGEDAHPTASRHFLQGCDLGALASRLEFTGTTTFHASELCYPTTETTRGLFRGERIPVILNLEKGLDSRLSKDIRSAVSKSPTENARSTLTRKYKKPMMNSSPCNRAPGARSLLVSLIKNCDSGTECPQIYPRGKRDPG